jgi:hypothetical protein
METEPKEPLEELGNVLTQVRVYDEALFFHIEKLVEVIQMELRLNIFPEMAEGQSTSFQWTDGIANIFISIHVEEEYQVSYTLELTGFPR